jgi:hypothetical protein
MDSSYRAQAKEAMGCGTSLCSKHLRRHPSELSNTRDHADQAGGAVRLIGGVCLHQEAVAGNGGDRLTELTRAGLQDLRRDGQVEALSQPLVGEFLRSTERVNHSSSLGRVEISYDREGSTMRVNHMQYEG